MKQALHLEHETYIVLSTAHISRSTALALSHRPDMCDASDQRFRIPLACALAADCVLPPDLLSLLTTIAAAAPEAYGVMLDADGPVISGLATFDWEMAA
ncbi:MAG: hypothetical protein ABL931_00335 [Usitatibacteraceae bacterium]